MEPLKPSRSQVHSIPARKLLISFVPEDDLGIANQPKMQNWANLFAKYLNANKKRNFSTLIYSQPGKHNNDNTRISGTYTDFLVVVTTNYVATQPIEFKKIINELKQLGEQPKTLMWLALYDAVKIVRLTKEFKQWHVLTGKGKNGERFRKPGEDPAWEDDLTDAANIIHDHPTCEKLSPICPKYRL